MLGVGDMVQAGGKDLITAAVLAYEIQCRLCDASSLVTSARGQPTMTIQALAYRAADLITALAKRGEISV